MIQQLAWCDGAVVPLSDVVVSGHDRTVQIGLGAFETVRLWGGVPFLIERHLERLAASLSAVGLPRPAHVDGLADGLVALGRAQGVRSALARITITAGPAPDDGDSGLGVESGMRVLVHLRTPPAPPASPVVVGIADFAHDVRSPLAGVKSTSYLVHHLLRDRAAAAGRLDDLMVDAEGRVTEATASNVFVVRDGRLITPPVTEGILAGITRGLVLELASEAGVPTEEAALSRADLAGVDEAFLTGAGKGVVRIDVLDGRQLPVARPVGQVLTDAHARAISRVCGVELDEVLAG